MRHSHNSYFTPEIEEMLRKRFYHELGCVRGVPLNDLALKWCMRIDFYIQSGLGRPPIDPGIVYMTYHRFWALCETPSRCPHLPAFQPYAALDNGGGTKSPPYPRRGRLCDRLRATIS